MTRPAIRFIRSEFGDKPLIGAEIGVFKGMNAAEILNHLSIKKLYLIDMWGHYTQEGQYLDFSGFYERVLQKFKGKENVIVIKQNSVDASKRFKDNSLDFVYIDACHQYESVREDIQSWFSKVREGGIISGHDYCVSENHDCHEWPGIAKAVNEFIERTGCVLEVGENHSDGIADWMVIKETG